MAPCPVCGAAATRLPESRGDYALTLYGQCGLRLADPMRHPGRDWYEPSAIYEEVQWNVPDLAKLRGRWEFVRALQLCRGSEGRCLDVGCGQGDFLVLARELGLQVSGLDHHAVRRIPGFQGPGWARKCLRGTVKIPVAAVATALASHPRWGGFTLLATGVR